MLHVTFSPSGAGHLTHLFRELGREERVIYLSDDMSVGPLGLATRERVQALEHLLHTDLPDLAESIDAFWREVLAAPAVTIWMGRHCISEHAGWLEVVHRRDAPISMLDVIDFFPKEEVMGPAFAVTPRRLLVECRVADRATIIDDSRRAVAHELWKQLRADYSPLRIVDGDTLRSAPITHYDPLLLAQATDDWQSVMTVVGQAMALGISDPSLPRLENGTLEAARVLHLIDDRALEADSLDEAPSRARVRRLQSARNA